MKREGKAKPKGELEVTVTATGPDGTTYTVSGCSVEEVQAAVAELTAPKPTPTGPADIQT